MTRAGLVRLSTAFVATVCLSGLVASAQSSGTKFSAVLEPEQEVPAVDSLASGTFELEINDAAKQISYTLSYSGLKTAVAQAHIHIGQPNVTGGIVLWLCEGTVASPIATTKTCPTGEDGGTVSDVLGEGDVVASGTASQQIADDEFTEVVALIRKGLAYANVHTAASGSGEIRGQIRPGSGHK